ncbi:hypothetical protein BDF20DRAFT_986789 [Mycotypha africana]|uniref:uncharacterized protein n=1 Tax=Mycotypha africana TaxID=64632 RepID=UPI0023017802|nr:uncharacterized protein BDF20DRAFT_986789 [Mycotypha africana]KAI8981771.1 hypothetical protein BDF20DRAFT_986789 [Mycotypha africana]
MMTGFPEGWFYIQCPSRQNQVLTVSKFTMQPSVRVELLPQKLGFDHQLWCYHQGFLVNKHSGCVLGTERDRLKDQHIFQCKRLHSDNRKQQPWKYDEQEQKLIMTDVVDQVEYALCVPEHERNIWYETQLQLMTDATQSASSAFE